jgi:hypothetical protein
MSRTIILLARYLVLISILCMSVTIPQDALSITWEIGTLVSDNNVGRYCDLQIDDDGNMHVVYLRADNGTLEVMSQSGGEWQSPEAVDESGSVAGHCGMSVTPDGTPRVSYRRTDTNALWYAGPEDAARWSTGTVADAGDAGRFCDLQVDSLGNMHVAYLQADDGALHVASSIGDNWQSPEAVDESGSVAGHCGMSVTPDGTPRVSYRRTDTNALWYAGPEIAPRWTVATLYETAGDAGRYVSFAQAPDGRFGSVFYRYDPHSLGSISLLVVENDSVGATRMVVDSVATSPSDPAHADLAIGLDGRWHIAFRNNVETVLYYVTADTVITGVGEDEPPPTTEVLTEFGLFQNFPNPFNPVTTIKYGLSEKVQVSLEIYDVGGRLVRRLVDDVQGPGPYSVGWDGTNHSGEKVASGVYFYRLKAGQEILTRKMVLLK